MFESKLLISLGPFISGLCPTDSKLSAISTPYSPLETDMSGLFIGTFALTLLSTRVFMGSGGGPDANGLVETSLWFDFEPPITLFINPPNPGLCSPIVLTAA